MSKHRLQISLSQAAASKLEGQGNKSQYIEDLILGNVEQKAPWKDLEYQIDQLGRRLQDVAIDESSDLPSCCSNDTPCKHWSHDGLNDEWTNSLSGEVKQII